MEEYLPYFMLGTLKSLVSTVGFVYYRRHKEELRPLPEKPLIDKDRYANRQKEIMIKYEQDLEARINSKIF